MPHTDLGQALAQRYGPTAPQLTQPLHHPVLAAQLNHRTVRSFLADALPPDLLEALVAVAQSAPSSSNLQSWSVVAVQDPAQRQTLAALAGHQAHIAQAPLLLVWVADLSRALRIAQRNGQPIEAHTYLDTFLMAAVDAGLAAQNVVVATEALGYGTVYIGALRNQAARVAELLALPEGSIPVVGLVIGRPDPAVQTGIKPRLPIDQVLHREVYRVPGDEAESVADYDQRLGDFQLEQGLPVVGWTPAVLQRLRDGQALNGRERLRDVVQQTGFALR